MNKKKTYTILILTFVFMIVSFALSIFLFNLIKTKNQNSSSLSLNIDQKIKEKNNLSNLDRVIKDTSAQREVLQSYILDISNPDKFIDWLETNGTSLNTEVIVNTINNTPDKNMVEVSLTAIGEFEDVLKFVFFIENTKYKIDIKELFLSKIKRQEKENSPEVYLWQGQVKFTILSSNI